MKLIKTTFIFTFLILGFISANAQKIPQDSIKILLKQKEYLKIAVDINELKIKLANEINEGESIREEAASTMKKAENAAVESKVLTVKAEVGNQKSIKKASSAASKASKLASIIEKLDDNSRKSDKKVEDYKKEINKLDILQKKYE